MTTKLVSIIVPVYNAENILHLAFDSILKQTYPSLEVVAINDCSSDKSSTKLDKYISQFESRGYIYKIVNHQINKGVAAARNTGLDNASGDYIYSVDADDWMEVDTIERLMRKAETENADIVGCNWYLSFEKNERKMNQPAFATSEEALRLMTNGLMRWNLWLFLTRRSLYEDSSIRFISGANMGEDMMVMLKLFFKAESVAFIDQTLYHYSRLNNTLTASFSQKNMREVTENMQEVERFFSKEQNKGKVTENMLLQLKLNIKLPLLFTGKRQDFLLWREWFSEANKVVLQNKCLPLHTKIIQWCAYKHLFLPIKLYNAIVLKFIYGILYK